MNEQNQPFFLIWNPDGKSPTVKHQTFQSARREAERLARNNRGHRFIVMASMEAFSLDEVVKTDLRPGPADWDGIPF